MATSGYYVFVWEEWYYIYYHHFDSYPGYLGDILVDTIKEMNLNDWECLKRKLKSERECKFSRKLSNKGVQMDSCILARSCPDLSCDIEWIYCIDLNNNVFEVNGVSCSGSTVHLKYDLGEIPRKWYGEGM